MPDILQKLDETILFFIQEHIKCPALDRVMVYITSLGNAGFIWITIGILLLLIKYYQKCGITMLCGLKTANYLCSEVLKPFIGRVRPCNKFTEIPLLIHAPHSPSFPSGHTMAGFACATVLFYFDKQLGIAGYILASLIAFSRMYLFVHYPTDILGGILYGTVVSLILIFFMRSIYHFIIKRFPLRFTFLRK